MAQSTPTATADLLHGSKKIGAYLGGKTARQIAYLARKDALPIFKIGDRYAMRISAYERYCAEREAAAA